MTDISITLVSNEILKGDVYCIDPVTSAIILKGNDNTYSLINADAISNIDGDLSTMITPDPIKSGLTVQLDNDKIKDKELKAMIAAEKEIDSQNFNVDVKVQLLFDRMRNIFPCVWEKSSSNNNKNSNSNSNSSNSDDKGSAMVIFEQLYIPPPYTTVLVKNGCSDDGIERVKKVLSGERRKLGME